MRVVPSLIAFVVVLAILDWTEARMPDMSCKEMLTILTKKQLGGIAACQKKLKLTGKDKSKKINCVFKCILMGEGLLDETGKMSKVGFEKYIQEEAPSNLADVLVNGMGGCRDKFGDNVDPDETTDPYCKSYDPLIKCFMSALPNLCPKTK